jgi:hypothetical protein
MCVALNVNWMSVAHCGVLWDAMVMQVAFKQVPIKIITPFSDAARWNLVKCTRVVIELLDLCPYKIAGSIDSRLRMSYGYRRWHEREQTLLEYVRLSYVEVHVAENDHRIKCVRSKVELFLYTPWRHTGGLEVYLHSFLTSALDGGSGQSEAQADLSPWKELHYRLNRRVGGPQIRCGLFGLEVNFLPLSEFEALTVQPVA